MGWGIVPQPISILWPTPMNLQDFRAKYPQYESIPDEDLAKGLHQKFYSNIPYEQFAKQVGLQTAKANPSVAAKPGKGSPALTKEGMAGGYGFDTPQDVELSSKDPFSRKPALSESEKARVDEATSADYGNVVSPKSDIGVPIREEMAPVARQEAERLLAAEKDPAKRMVLQDELKRPTSARRPIKLSDREAAYAAGKAADRTAAEQLQSSEVLTAPTGPEPSVGSVASGLASSLGQGADLTRQGVRAQFADAIGSDGMLQDALTQAGRVRNSIQDSTPAFESATASAAYSGLSSFVQQVPGLAAAVATGNPLPALAAAGLQTEAEAYTRYRERGATMAEALSGAVGEGAIEVITERLPIGVLVDKLGKTGTKNFLTDFLAKEVPGEQAATLAQDALDTAIANPDKTWGEYWKERPAAAWDTLVATAAMGGAIGSINIAARTVQALNEKADRAQSAIGAAQTADEALAAFNELSSTLDTGALDVGLPNQATSGFTEPGVPGGAVPEGSLPNLDGGANIPDVYAGSPGLVDRRVLGDVQTGPMGDANGQPAASVEGGATDVGALEDLVLPAETSTQSGPASVASAQSLPDAATPLSANSQNTISNSGQSAVQSELPPSEATQDDGSAETSTLPRPVLAGAESGSSAARAGSDRIAQLNALAQRRAAEEGITDLGSVTVTAASKSDTLALPRAVRGTVEAVAKAFGQKVVWYKPSKAANAYVADGFVVRGKADEASTIYLNIDGSVSPTRTAFHELLHQLRSDSPDIYDEFSAAIRPLIDQKQALRVSVIEARRSPNGEAGTQALGEDIYMEELAADIFSDSAHKVDFWLDIADRMTGQVASRFFKTVNTLLEKIKSALTSDRSFNSEIYVKDIEAARKAAAKAAAQYYVRQKQGGKSDLRNAMIEADQTAAETLESPRRKTEELGDFTFSKDKVGGITVFGEAEDIRSLLPDGVIGRVVNGGLAFTPADAPRVRGALAGNKLAYSRAGEVTDKLTVRNGKYVGAPPKYDTPGKISTLRRKLRTLTDEGAAGRMWYENSSKDVLKMVGGDVQEARKFVALLAIYPPQAKVDANSTFALRAWAQYKAGQPISIKQKAFDDKANAAMRDIDAFWSGEKTGNFFNNLLREIDPSTEGQQGATIDMWMMRAAEYPTDAPSKTQYSFMENETNRIARDLGWEPQQVQAAIWVAMKARMENPGVKKRTEASSEKKGWITYEYPEKNGRPVKTRKILNAQAHRDNWLKHAFAHDPTKTDTALAKFDFGDGLRRHIGQISVEARPSTKLPILPGVHSAPYAQQLEFQNAIRAAFLDEDGSDRLAQLLGLMVDTVDITVPGVWEGEVSPSTQLQVAMAPIAGADGKNEVDPDQAKLLDAYAAITGLALRQDGVGWHRPFYNATKKTSNGLQLDFGRAPQPQEVADIETAIDGWMRENNKPDNWRDSFALISTPSGVRMVSFGVVSVDELTGGILSAIDPVVAPGVQADWFKSSGNLVFNDWKENPNGEYYLERASASGRPDVLEWARNVLAPRVQSVYEEYSAKFGWGDPGELLFSNRRDQGREAGGSAESAAVRGQEQGTGSQVSSEDRRAQSRVARGDPLPGVPLKQLVSGPDLGLVDVAQAYARENGIDLKRQAEYVKVDEDRARRIAAAYEAMENAPQDSRVKEAYANLIQQTGAQYRALQKAGYRFWFIDTATDAGLSYADDPWIALKDLRDNKRLGVFPTASGFGSDQTFDATANPLFAETGLEWPVGGPDSTTMAPVYANDLFRAVHDAFGHGLEGAGFRAQGEENAWQAHVRLFTGSAVAAITSETRGQNSWVNYGPQGAANQVASAEDTFFADQKVGLMPEWTWTEGRAGDMLMSNRRQVDTPEFKRWFGDSKVVDANGDPLVVYHGTPNGTFNTFDPAAISDMALMSAQGPGFYFTDKKNATQYTKPVNKSRGFSPDKKLYEVYLSIQNPLRVTERSSTIDPEAVKRIMAKGDYDWFFDSSIGFQTGQDVSAMSRAEKAAAYVDYKLRFNSRPSGTDAILLPEITRAFRNKEAMLTAMREELNSDGVIWSDSVGEIYVAWSSSQIKSATDNNGQFDPENPDIRYSNRRAPVYTPDAGLVDIFKSVKADTRLMPKAVRNKIEEHPLAAEIKQVQSNFLDILDQLETDGLVKINC